jgi:heme exporter protein A
MMHIDQLVHPRIRLTLLKPLTFSLKAGEILWVVGSNGSGKSTLLNLVAGISIPQKGRIKCVPSFYCGHQTGLKLSLTVQENINFRCNFYGKTTHKERESALLLFQLKKIKNQLVGSLSAGQKQQVALASGVFSGRLVWLLDEPFSHLDDQAKIIFSGLLQDHIQKGGAAVITTHDFYEQKSERYLSLG